MPSFVRGKWDAPHWVSCSGALRAGTAAAEERTDGLQQHGADNGLAQEDAVGNPGRLLPHAVLVLRGDQDRRPGPGRRGEMVEQLETRHPREPNIEDQARIRLGHSAPEEFLRGSKGARLKSRRTQQPFQGVSVARVVLDDGDGASACGRVCVHDPNIANLQVTRYCTFGQFLSLVSCPRNSRYIAGGQLAVFQGASEAPISESYGSSEQRGKTANWPRPGGLR